MKNHRHRLILEILAQHDIETQEDLATALGEKGVVVTQATVSRDIKELGLIKIPIDNERYKYAPPQNAYNLPIDERTRRLFLDAVVGMDYSENIIVIKTLPGTAQGVAGAIDRERWEEVLGTVAGDDTIFVLVKPKDVVANLIAKLQKIIKGQK